MRPNALVVAAALLAACAPPSQQPMSESPFDDQYAETPIGLDEVTPLGFSATELLVAIGAPEWNGVVSSDPESQSHADDERLAAHSPFRASPDTWAASASWATWLDEILYWDDTAVMPRPDAALVVRLPVRLTSADGEFDTTSAVRLLAKGLEPDQISWREAVAWGATVGDYPDWVDSAIETRNVEVCDGAAEEIPVNFLPRGSMDHQRLSMSVLISVDEVCGSATSIAGVDLVPTSAEVAE